MVKHFILQKHNGYQRELNLMVNRFFFFFFDKNTVGVAIKNEIISNEN